MPLVDDWIFSRATTFPGLAALIETRCYPDVIPEEIEPEQPMIYPALRYLIVDSPPVARTHTLGPSGLARPRLQIDVYAETSTEAKETAEQVRLAFEGHQDKAASPRIDGVILENRRGMREPGSNLYRQILEFFVWHSQAVN